MKEVIYLVEWFEVRYLFFQLLISTIIGPNSIINLPTIIIALVEADGVEVVRKGEAPCLLLMKGGENSNFVKLATLSKQPFHHGTEWLTCKLVSGSQVGQVGPVDSRGQVGDLDPSLINSRNLSWVGQV